jgi:DNA-directed RNA polymerase specialized sigma24 family protein
MRLTELTQILQLLTESSYKFIIGLYRTLGLNSLRPKVMNDFHRHLQEGIPRLRRYARALTRNVPRADDLLQETLARFGRNTYGSPAPIRGPGFLRSCTIRI